MESLFDTEQTGGILHGRLPWLVDSLEWAAAIIDIFACLLLIIGAVRFILSVARAEVARRGTDRLRRTNGARAELGHYILAGLELFIVTDVIHTALSLALTDLVFLLLLVIIRAVISYFLDHELELIRRELDE
ncbi:DUF1622 domain-containing protein [Salibaculum sp.]|uniref:DUF1622 domain-containing protein n=1 Tax=Salibaculum sp. TaxID=2855480 RepID=UPI002B48C03B|nr:DUF1622 domain-containing protein [Salibaculum sp.]HKL68692.1 DUF1622 domain-containing protein [Salibaculum sp.]